MHSWRMAILHDAHELSVTEAARPGVAGLVADAEGGTPLVATRHRRPVAAVVSVERLIDIDAAVADLQDLALVLTRAMTDSGQRTSLDDVLAAFGHTRASLAAIPDDRDGE